MREFFRKLVHLVQLPILLGYTILMVTFSQRIGLLFLTVLLLICLEFEYFRIEYKPSFTKRIVRFFEKFILRKREKNNVVSAIFYIAGAIIAFAVFDYPVALLALLFTALGDLAAALTGTMWGKTKLFRNKSYVGSFSGLITNIAVGYLFLGEFPEIFLPMAIVASLVEMFTQKLDDNLTVPLFSGFTGQVIVFLAGIQLSNMLNF